MRLCGSLSDTRARRIDGVGVVGLFVGSNGGLGLGFCNPNTLATLRWGLQVQNSSPLGTSRRTFCSTIRS